MIKVLQIAGLTTGLIVWLVLATLAWMVGTTKGTSMLWSLLQSQIPEIQAERISGSLWKGIEFSQFRFQTAYEAIESDRVLIEIDFRDVLRRKAVINRIELGEIRYRQADERPAQQRSETFGEFSGILLLREIAVKQLSAQSFVYENTGWSASTLQAFARVHHRPETDSWVLDSQASTAFNVEKIAGKLNLEIQGPLNLLTTIVQAKSNAGDLNLRLQLSEALTRPGFELETKLAKFNPEVLLDQKLGQYELHLKAGGNTDKVDGHLSITRLTPSDFQPVDHSALLFSADSEQVQINNLSVSIAKKSVLQGKLQLEYAEWANATADLAITGLNLKQIRPDLPKTDWQGKLILRPGADHAEVRLELSDKNLGTLNALFGLTPEEVKLANLRFDSSSGSADISGRIALTGDQAFALSAKARNFNPGDFVHELDGDLSFSFDSKGSIQPLALDAHLKFEPGSSLKSQSLSGNLRFSRSRGGLASGSGGLSLGDSRIEVLSQANTLDIRVDKINPGLFVDNLDAEISGSTRLVFKPDTIRVDLQLKAPAFHYQNVSGQNLSATLRGNTTKLEDLALRLRIANVDINSGQARIEGLDLNGTPSDHQLVSKIISGDSSAKIVVSGAYSPPLYRGTLGALSIASVQHKQFELSHSVPFEAGPEGISLGYLILESSKSERLELALKLDLNRFKLHSKGRLHALQVNWPGLPSADFIREGILSAEWNLNYDNSPAPLSGRFTANLLGMKVAPSKSASESQLGIEKISVLLAGHGKELDIDLLVAQNPQNRLQSRIHADKLPGLQTLIEQTNASKNVLLGGQISVNLDDLSVLGLFEPRLLSSSGRFEVRAELSGTIDNPAIEGAAHLHDFGFSMPDFGLKATIPVADVKFDQQNLQLTRLDFATPDSRGAASATGRLSLAAGQLGNFSLALKGSSLQIIDQETFKLRISPDLRLAGTAEKLDIQGTIRVDKGLFTELSANQGVSLSPDVVMAKSESGPIAQSLPPELSSRGIHLLIEIDIPNSFTVNAAGADLLLGGKLNVFQARAGIPLADGELAVVKANKFTKNTYTAYGQVLQIKQGSLLFARSPVNDPGLNILAVRKVKVGEVGVHVTGTANAPEIQLQSDPAMADSEILSWLVLGRPSNEAGEGFGALLLAASSEYTGGASLVEQTREWIGLDELSLDSEDDTTSGIVTLGKRIGENLYLSYQQGILEQGYKIKAIYVLTPAWSLIAESARLSNAVEIEWSKRF